MEDFYWSDNKVITYNSLFTMIVGVMGNGKTFCKKRRAIKNAIAGKGEFIYLRRTQSELNESAKKFFDDMTAEFPEYSFDKKDNQFLFGIPNEKGKVDVWNTLGWCAYLSGARKHKSVSNSKVTDIIFDEFIVPTRKAGAYLPDEITAFFEFYESVARLRDVRVWFLANAVTRYNPYFLFFNINIPSTPGIYKIKEDLVVEMVANQEYVKKKKESRFGKLVAGTDFEKTAYNNEFVEDNVYNEIVKKTKESIYYMTLERNGKYYGVYKDHGRQIFIVSGDANPQYPLKYDVSLKNGKVNPMTRKLWHNYPRLKNFFEAFTYGLVYFDDFVVMGECIEIFRQLY